MIPQEIEEILGAHPAVVECAVVGVNDKEAGQYIFLLIFKILL